MEVITAGALGRGLTLKVIEAQKERWYDMISLVDDEYNETPTSVTEYWYVELQKMYVK